MVKVFYDSDSLTEEFSDKLQKHNKVHYSKEWDAYLIKNEDYESVFNELEFDKQLEFDNDELLNWDIKIKEMNEMVEVQYEQKYITVLRKEFHFYNVSNVDIEDSELLSELCEAEDWGKVIEETVDTQMSANISDELSDEVRKLKEKGFDIVLY